MISRKNKTALFVCAAQRFEPSTFRFKVCCLPKQTTTPSTMLVAHVIKKKSRDLYKLCSLGMHLQITHLQSGIYLGYL